MLKSVISVTILIHHTIFYQNGCKGTNKKQKSAIFEFFLKTADFYASSCHFLFIVIIFIFY